MPPAETSSPPAHVDRLLDRAALFTLAVVAAVALLTFRDYGLGWDDYTHSQYGELLVALYASGFADTRALSFVNLYMYGGAFDMAAALMAKILPFDLFETRRLAGALVGLLGLFVTWRIARHVGGALAGLVALLLLALCPLYVGHMFVNAKDVPFAVAMAVLLLGLVRALDEYPAPSRGTVVIVGLGLGLAIGSRIMAGFGVIAALAALAVIVAHDARTGSVRDALARCGRFIVALLPAAVLGYAVMALIWPWSVADPLNPFRAIGYFSEFFEKPWDELFAGRIVPVPDMPRSYVPTLFALQMPEAFLLFALGGLAVALAAIARAGETPRRRAILMAVVLFASLPLIVTIVTRPAMYNGIRHFVFVLPPLAVLGGLAAGRIGARIASQGRRLRAAAAAALMLGLMLPLAAMVRLHPYQYAYFNDLAGGAGSARSLYMLDYWGLALKQASQKLAGRSRRTRRGPARRPAMAHRGVRPASAGAGRARRPLPADLGSQGRRLRDVARRILLRRHRRAADRARRARRRDLRAGLRHARTDGRTSVHPPAGGAGKRTIELSEPNLSRRRRCAPSPRQRGEVNGASGDSGGKHAD